MSETNLATNMTEQDPTETEVQETAAHLPGTASQTAGGQNLELVMDIPVTLSMELGRTRMSIQDLLQLNSGSVVELQRMADEPMDVLVNGTLVAHGEAVVIGEKFGVRLTDVVSAKERVKRIR